MTVEQLIVELEKHPPQADVDVCVKLSSVYKLSAESVAFEPSTNTVVIVSNLC